MDKRTCFVIQPFDRGKFDKRYEDVFSPAIKAADLRPYRVDTDPAVIVPIESIERGIQDSVACLADITLDNPNVWYELGFSFASGKPVVMVCSEERENRKHPFDIQHRSIIPYKSDSTQDFDRLKGAITTKLKALLKKGDTLNSIASHQTVASIQGMSQPELAVLAAAAGSVAMPDDLIAVYSVKQDVENAGFTSLGFALGLKRLREKKFLSMGEDTDYNGNTSQCIMLHPDAWEWIEQHENMFILRAPAKQSSGHVNPDDLPF
jgi:hypothetical protein